MSQEVREDYLESLEELTVNSRPIIKTLTEIAQENVEHALAVVDAIETHTLNCPPNHKLPALYLIDSICKNVGEPYCGFFAPRVVQIFAMAFTVSVEPVRMKMNELFKTWTAPQPLSNQPLFSHDVLRQINDFMMRQQPAQPVQAAVPVGMPHMPAPPVSRPRLNQSALMVIVNQLVQQLEQDEQDTFTECQLSLLRRIEARVSGVVDPKMLPQIHQEIEGIREARMRHQSRPPSQGRNNRNGPNRGPSGPHRNRKDTRDNRGDHRDGREGRDGRDGRDARDGRNGGNRVNGGIDKITGTNNVPIGTRKRSALEGIDLGKLAQSLDSVKRQHTETPGLGGLFVEGWDLAKAASTDVNPKLVDQLYAKNLPLQCSTCGYRFHDTPEGRAAKEAEMDWHFRANKDMMEGHSRNRCWFLTEASWIAYRDEDEVLGVGSELASNNVNGEESINGNKGMVDLDAEKTKYIPVPSDNTAQCPVCQEPHETSWSEEAENWVWMNTVEVEGRYFHATCFADPQNQKIIESILGSREHEISIG